MAIEEKSSEKLSNVIINSIREKQGIDVVLMDFRKIHNSISEFFVICHGTSNVHIETIAESVMDDIRTNLGQKPVYKEGFQNAEWILLDYVDVVVHIFNKEKREFYQLEKLWADAEFAHFDEN